MSDPGGIQRLQQLISDTLDLAAISLFLMVATIFLLPSTQRRWAYAAAGIGLGIAGGLAVRWWGLGEGWVIVGTLAGVLTGPATVIAVQGKTAMQVIDEIKSLRDARRSGDSDTNGGEGA